MRLTGKQQGFVNYYTYTKNEDTYDNGTESAIRAGYKGNNATLRSIASENLTKPNIIACIDEIRAKTRVKADYNYNKAILQLDEVIQNLSKAAKTGNIQANTALTAAIREKNAITGLHKQTIKHEGAERPSLSEAEKRALADVAKDDKLRLSETG